MIRGGRLIAYTTPAEARAAIEGTIHEGTISAHDYHRLLAESDRCVTQAYLVEGRNRVRVYQPDGQPPEGFVNVPATLEDAYLVAIKTGRLEAGTALWAGAKAVVSNGTDSRTAIAERGDR
jgi:ABC-2 type transport system ATP-binding protein